MTPMMQSYQRLCGRIKFRWERRFGGDIHDDAGGETVWLSFFRIASHMARSNSVATCTDRCSGVSKTPSRSPKKFPVAPRTRKFAIFIDPFGRQTTGSNGRSFMNCVPKNIFQ